MTQERDEGGYLGGEGPVGGEPGQPGGGEGGGNEEDIGRSGCVPRFQGSPPSLSLFYLITIYTY